MTTVYSPSPISMDSPWRWLGAGWRDLWAAPVQSIGYGLVIVGGGFLIIYGLWKAHLAALIPVALGVFALIGPLLALGLYEASRRQAAGEAPGLYPVRFETPRAPEQIAYIGFFLLFAALVWVLLAMGLYAIVTAGSYMPLDRFVEFALTTPQGLTMLVVGTLVGGAVAFAIYLLTVVSIPMLMNEKVDAFTAIGAGLRAFKSSPGTMLLWAWLIGILIVGGVATMFVGLAVIFPLLGHATWHAYRDIRAAV
ncbi:MAG: DUF2189 domain-containing protein [Parvularculaceae bacterium]|nr:DUF2189 domain-containing protein [Parvularculaceae bacterium]